MHDAPQPHGHRWRLVLAALAASLALLTGCAGPAPSDPETAVSTEANKAANDADLHFAETMPGHHDQAIEMSNILLDKPGVTTELEELAQRVRGTHQGQLDTMTTWAGTWAADPNVSHTEDPGQDSVGHHGGQGGLMTEDQMKALDLADTPDAQKLYLDGMIRHHQGALTIAADEVKNGKNQDATTLAQTIADAHPDDIATMTALRATL